MPKDRKSRSVSFDRHSPFRFSDNRCISPFLSYSAMAEGSSSSSSASDEDIKEWDEVRCPVCMEQPHNSVLLICSSHDKGCRPFMCDTSYRHSNCLDQYRKACDALAFETERGSMANLSCPLCRGVVFDWKVVQTARKYLNTKVRNCSTETCGFSGAYGELRKHARTEHPFVRPSEADSERQQDWRRMELQRDIGDFISSIESSIGEWDESLGFHGEGGEFGGLFHMPSRGVFLILSFRGSGDLSRNTGRVSVRRGYSRSSRGQRARARVLSGEAFSEVKLRLLVDFKEMLKMVVMMRIMRLMMMMLDMKRLLMPQGSPRGKHMDRGGCWRMMKMVLYNDAPSTLYSLYMA